MNKAFSFPIYSSSSAGCFSGRFWTSSITLRSSTRISPLASNFGTSLACSAFLKRLIRASLTESYTSIISIVRSAGTRPSSQNHIPGLFPLPATTTVESIVAEIQSVPGPIFWSLPAIPRSSLLQDAQLLQLRSISVWMITLLSYRVDTNSIVDTWAWFDA